MAPRGFLRDALLFSSSLASVLRTLCLAPTALVRFPVRPVRRARCVMTVLAAMLGLPGMQVVFAQGAPPPPAVGDVYASTCNKSGKILRFRPDGPLAQTLDTGTSDCLTGSVFDAQGNFYVTDFFGGTIVKFDPTGKLIGPFASGLSTPESIVFDGSGNIYVSEVGDGGVVKLDASGNSLATFAPGVRTDWIDLASDQCTIYYTTEGTSIMRFNVCTNTPMTNFADNLSDAFALRIRPNGEVIVANGADIVRLNADGTPHLNPDGSPQTYGEGLGETIFFAANLDPDGTSFWSADAKTGDIYRFDIASGKVLKKIIGNNTETTGLTILGQIAVAVKNPPTCTLNVDNNSGHAPFTINVTAASCSPGANGGSLRTATLDWGDNSPQITFKCDGNCPPGPPFTGSHTYQNVGTFTATMSTTDSNGMKGSASQQITVTQGTPPTCSLKFDTTTGPAPLMTNASASCQPATNGGFLRTATLDWGDKTPPAQTTCDGGCPPSGSFGGPHTYQNAGTFTATVSTTDSNGLKGSASQTITVTTPVDSTPKCTVGSDRNNGPAPLTVVFQGSCTDAGNDLGQGSTGTLNFGDNASQPVSAASFSNVSHQYANAGTFQVTYTSTDASQHTGTATETITVTQPVNSTPTCMVASDKNDGGAPLTVVFHGSCSDAGNDLGQGSTGTLNFGDNASQAVSASSFTNVSHQYVSAGTFQVTYTSTDASKNTGTATETITVTQPVDSTPKCTVGADKTNGQAPLSVIFQGSCTDAGNDLGQGSTGTLDFGDKSSQPVSASSFSNVSHQYANAGTFAVVYSVTDAAGLKGSATQTVTVSAPPPPTGFSPNVFVGVSGGNVQEYAPDGSLVATHTTGLGGTVAGIAFDKANNLYAVDLTAANVSKFDPSGKLIGTFGGGYNCQPEMIVFDGAGDAYVGQQGCSHQILKFDSNGTLLQQFQVATENTGSDDLALSADECTMLYTSEGPSVLRFDVCKGQQLSPFATGLKKALVPRILPDGSVLVSEVSDIVRLSPTGQPMQHYTAPGEQCWYALAVDQHGSSFWAADFCSSNIHQFDLASGNELAKFNTGTANGTVFGLGMAGSGLNVAGVGNAGTITASPQSATVTAGQPATFTVTLAADPQAAGLTFTLSCAGLPAGGSCAFSPPSVEAQGSAVTSNLTIATGGMVAASHHETRWIFASLISIFPAFVLLGTAGPRRRRVFFITLAIICLTGLMSIGCSGGRLSGNQNSTPVSSRGAFNVIVVGTSGQMQVSTTVQLNVQ